MNVVQILSLRHDDCKNASECAYERKFMQEIRGMVPGYTLRADSLLKCPSLSAGASKSLHKMLRRILPREELARISYVDLWSKWVRNQPRAYGQMIHRWESRERWQSCDLAAMLAFDDLPASFVELWLQNVWEMDVFSRSSFRWMKDRRTFTMLPFYEAEHRYHVIYDDPFEQRRYEVASAISAGLGKCYVSCYRLEDMVMDVPASNPAYSHTMAVICHAVIMQILCQQSGHLSGLLISTLRTLKIYPPPLRKSYKNWIRSARRRWKKRIYIVANIIGCKDLAHVLQLYM